MTTKQAHMEAKTLAEAKADFERLMDEAVESHEPVIITREGNPSVALISLRDQRGAQAADDRQKPRFGPVCKPVVLDVVARRGVTGADR